MEQDWIESIGCGKFDRISENAVLKMDDCIQAMKCIESETVDACITDPPYFIDGMGCDWDAGKVNEKIEQSKLVHSIPIRMKFDPQQGKDLQTFIGKVSTEVFRILKPGGFYIGFSQGRLYHRMAVAVEDCGFEIRDMLAWKRKGYAKAFSQEHFIRQMDAEDAEKERLLKSLEGRKTPQLAGTFEPIVLAQKPKCGTFVENWMRYGVGLIDASQTLDGGFPSTIMDVPKPSKAERNGCGHPTMKPVKLMRHLVGIFAPRNGIVIDPFLGSGSTGIACLNTSRRFIGIEACDAYFNEARKRMLDSIQTDRDAFCGLIQ